MAERRVAVVTGAGNGIGREVARRLLAAGHKVVGLDIDAASAGNAVPGAHCLGADVTNSASVRSAFAEIERDVGPVDMLVNCVGASLHERRLEDVTDEDYDATFDLNVRSVFLCTRAVIAGMKTRRWGRVINVSAVAGRTYTLFGGADFTAAKAALIGFTRQVALEVAETGVTINTVAPGLTLSERVAASWARKPQPDRDSILQHVPARRPSSVEEQAAPILFLLSEEAAYICGACLDVNGAMFVP
jgi:3-oxoacyl-[acyl-carrier protein] reductase